MARIRSVHPELCTDDVMARLPAEVERTFVRLWTHLDDEGRCVDNPQLIKAALLPLHDDVTVADVDEHLDELAAVGLLRRYEANGKRFLTVKPESWKQWQKPRHRYESKFPPPPVRPTSDLRRTDVGPASAGEERSGGRRSEEGESEGEPVGAHLYPQAAGSEHNHAAGTGARLAARAASHAPQLSVVTDSSSAPASTQRETQP